VALKPTFILFDSTKNSYSVWGVKSPENPDSYSSFCYDDFLKCLMFPTVIWKFNHFSSMQNCICFRKQIENYAFPAFSYSFKQSDFK